jgi:uncharacterized protein
MLELRPNCELCDKDLPPKATDAPICSDEGTFCAACVEGDLDDVCPICGGGFRVWSIRARPSPARRTALVNDPPGSRRPRTTYAREEVASFAETLRGVPRGER